MVGAGLVFVALAAVFWGLSGGIGGILISEGWDASVVAFFRGVVAATLMYCAPVFVYLISFALKFEQPTAFKWAAITLVLLGVVLLTRVYDLKAMDMTLLGIGAGLLSGLSYALFIFSFKYAAPKGSPQAILSIALTVLAVTLILPGDFNQTMKVPGSADWPMFIALGLVGAGLPFILYIRGLKHTAPAVASIVAMVEPVTASLFGVVVMREELTQLQLVGMILILVTVTALSVYSNAKHQATLSGNHGRY